MFSWLLDIVSDNGKPDFEVTIWDNIINTLEENPSVFWIYLFAFIGLITVIVLPLNFLIKKGRKWCQQDNKNNKEECE